MGHDNTNTLAAAYDKAQELAKINNAQASKELRDALRNRRNFNVWTPIAKQMVKMLIDLGFEEMQNSEVFNGALFAISMARDRLSTSASLESEMTEILNYYLESLKAKLRGATELTREMVAAPCDEDQIIAAFTGVSIQQLAHSRYFDAGEGRDIFSLAIKQLLQIRYLGSCVGLQDLISKIGGNLMDIAEEFQLQRSCKTVVDGMRSYYNDLLFKSPKTANEKENQKESRLAVLRARAVLLSSKDMIQNIFSFFCKGQEVSMRLNNWDAAWEAFSFLHSHDDDWDKHGKKTMDIQELLFRTHANIFQQCGNWTFYAHCVRRTAETMMQNREAVDPAHLRLTATEAVLTALSAPVIDEKRGSFAYGYDEKFNVNDKIATWLDLPYAPSRNKLIEAITQRNILNEATPEAKELFAIFATETCTTEDCKKVDKLMASISNTTPKFTHFSGGIRKAVLGNFFQSIALSCPILDLHRLHSDANFTGRFDDDYAEVLEPFLLNEIPYDIIIDHVTSKVSFVQFAYRRIHSLFKAVAAADLKVPTFRLPAQRTISLDAIEADVIRSLELVSMQKNRMNNEKYRIKEQEEKEKNLKKRGREEREKAERNRHLLLLQREEKEKEAKLEEHLALNRRKMVIEKIRNKYQFQAPMQFAEVEDAEFVNRLTTLLTEHQKKQEQQKLSETQSLNYFARYCRELEIPKRKEMGVASAARAEADRQLRQANYLEQHQKDWEAKKNDKALLQDVMEYAGDYESRYSGVSATNVDTKRAKQEEILRQEKIRLANS